MELDDHLFRRESGRLVAVLTKIFGIHNLPIVEDVVQDAFFRALQTWKLRGIPENPSAWLTATAKNRAVDVIRRERTARKFAPEMGQLLESEWTLANTVHESFDPQAIEDDVLRMMFTCCQPKIHEAAQVALVLNLVCGFSIQETAGAFLVTPEAMEKRIARAKKTLTETRQLFDIFSVTPECDRLPAVHRAVYLLFNEGFHGSSPLKSSRSELCSEAIRLGDLLLVHPETRTPASYALSSLMALHGARMASRMDSAGSLVPFLDQDRSLWDKGLIARGELLLVRSASGPELTSYHIEAAIAAVHARAPSADETDWRTIVSLYETLMAISPSPVVALNRAVAVGQSSGAEAGLREIDSIADLNRLARYPFLRATIGEFHRKLGNVVESESNFEAAIKLSRNASEREFLKSKLANLRVEKPVNYPPT